MKTLAIIWHSRTGAARQLAQAMAEGAREAARQMQTPLRICELPAEQATLEEVLQADGLLFCAPENLASLSGEMKAFFDRHYYPVGDALAGRPYGIAISAGTDGAGAARQTERICTGWRLRLCAAPLIVRNGAQTPQAILAPKTLDGAARAQAQELGGLLAATLLLAA